MRFVKPRKDFSGLVCSMEKDLPKFIRAMRHLRDLVIPAPPWREESTPQTFGNVLSSDWIRFRGNDRRLEWIPIPNDTSTQDLVVGHDVEVALRRHLAT